MSFGHVRFLMEILERKRSKIHSVEVRHEISERQTNVCVQGKFGADVLISSMMVHQYEISILKISIFDGME